MTELKTGGAQGYLRIATEEAFITRGGAVRLQAPDRGRHR